MESYSLADNKIMDTTIARESNSMIMRKGRSTLLASKVMLYALLRVENRSEKYIDIKESQYYNAIKNSTGVDYSSGLVAEMTVSELVNLLGKKGSGSFYASLKELFSIDPYEEKSLRNSWAVMMPNEKSGVLGYAEVISACHYDTVTGRLFIKFSDEEFIRSQIWQIKSEYTELPLTHMLNIKSVYTYRLYEILYCELSKAEAKEEQSKTKNGLYKFSYPIGELVFMMGSVDVVADKTVKKDLSKKNCDYNDALSDFSKRQNKDFKSSTIRRKIIDTAVNEINATPTSAFLVSYEMERGPKSRRFTTITFFVHVKEQSVALDNLHEHHKKGIDEAEVIFNLSKELSEFSLSYEEIQRIAKASDFDEGVVVAAKILYEKLGLDCDFVIWFEDLRSDKK